MANVHDASNEQTESVNLRLIHAVRMINLPEVYEALESGANANFDKNKPLAFAAAIGETDVVAALLQNGAEVDGIDESGRTPLIFAVKNRNFSSAKYLIQSGANINATDRKKNTPLHVASAIGHQPLVRTLLENGANPMLQNATTNNCGTLFRGTAIDEAAVHNHPEVIEILLETGIDIEIQTNRGHTPLLAACTYGSFEAAKLLVARGANVHAIDSALSRTGLHTACYKEYEEIVKLLVDAGADIKAEAKSTFNDTILRNATPLEFAAIGEPQESSGRIATLLLSKGAPEGDAMRYAQGRNEPVVNALKAHRAAQNPPENPPENTPQKKPERSFFRRMLS